MREDIVSWVVEDKVERVSYYYRNAYKEPNLNKPISREEAVPVYEQDNKFN